MEDVNADNNNSNQELANYFTEVRAALERCQQCDSLENISSSLNQLFVLLTKQKVERMIQGKFSCRNILCENTLNEIDNDKKKNILRNETTKESDFVDTKVADNLKTFEQLLMDNFEKYVWIVIEFLQAVDAGLRMLALDILFALIRHESSIILLRKKSSNFLLDNVFPTEFFRMIITQILLVCRNFQLDQQYISDLISTFTNKYLVQFSDLRHNFLCFIVSVLQIPYTSQNSGGMLTNLSSLSCSPVLSLQFFYQSSDIFAWNLHSQLFNIISILPSPTNDLDASKCFVDSQVKSIIVNKYCSIAVYKKTLEKAWLLLVHNIFDNRKHNGNLEDQNDRTKIVDKLTLKSKIISFLSKKVLPYVAQPLLFADIFIQVFQQTTPISLQISALQGLFYLLCSSNLGDINMISAGLVDYAKIGNGHPLDKENDCMHGSECSIEEWSYFYSRLYRLVCPAAFYVSDRGDFMHLLWQSLRSRHLPSSMLYTFLFKCARTATLVPPHSALWLLSLILSLATKHPVPNSCLKGEDQLLPPFDICTTTCPKLYATDNLFHSFKKEFISCDLSENINTEIKDVESRIKQETYDNYTNINGFNTSANGEHCKLNNYGCNSGVTKKQRLDLNLCFPKDEGQRASVDLCQNQLYFSELDLFSKHYLHQLSSITVLYTSGFSNKKAPKLDPDDFQFLNCAQLVNNELLIRKLKYTSSSTRNSSRNESVNNAGVTDVSELHIPPVAFSAPTIPGDAMNLMNIAACI